MNRRWRVPPPPIGGLDAAVGAAVLEENAGSIGILLWDAARDVVLWSTSSRDELADLFAPAAERMRMTSVLTTMLDRKLESALQGLARLVGRPALANRERASMACREIAQWADDQGAIATAYAFAHAAALCCPGNARLSYEAGRIARRRADYGVAHAWLSRAALLGRQGRDWDTYARSFSGLGNSFIQRGDYPRARKYHLRCLRIASSHQLRELEADSCHDLCVIAIEAGQSSEATSYARKAYDLYGAAHPRLPMLAHDVAYSWMTEGYFSRALEVFTAMLPFCDPTERRVVLSDICRAAAGTGDVSRYEDAWADTWDLIESRPDQHRVAEALLDLARGAGTIGHWDRGRRAATASLGLATERREAKVQFAAEATLEWIDREQSASRVSVVVEVAESQEVEELAADLVESLNNYATAGV
jgi:tetratricopeptide (TPR) repeat protein